jgi:hypothetical protein
MRHLSALWGVHTYGRFRRCDLSQPAYQPAYVETFADGTRRQVVVGQSVTGEPQAKEVTPGITVFRR